MKTTHLLPPDSKTAFMVQIPSLWLRACLPATKLLHMVSFHRLVRLSSLSQKEIRAIGRQRKIVFR